MAITLNDEQRLYVIPLEKGWTTALGYDYTDIKVEKMKTWIRNRAGWEGTQFPAYGNGTLAQYDLYCELCSAIQHYCTAHHTQCDIELIPELIGLEGKRIEIVDCDGTKRRFYVGKSTGWIPCHLEIARSDSSGGIAVYGTPFQSIKVLDKRRY